MEVGYYNGKLRAEYTRILSQFDFSQFSFSSTSPDKYSEPWLPQISQEYLDAPKRILLYGRESAGWPYRASGSTTGITDLKRAIEIGELDDFITRGLKRHKALAHKPSRKSRFMQYRDQLQSACCDGVKESVVHCNLFAWDYDKAKFLDLKQPAISELFRLSAMLTAAQVDTLQPDFVVFASGLNRSVRQIRSSLTEHELQTDKREFEPKKFWKFSYGKSTCFRVAHPRAMSHGHPDYRKRVIDIIRES